MRRRLTQLLTCGVLLLTSQSWGQSSHFAINKKNSDSVYHQPFMQRPLSVNLNLGTTGIGVAGRLNFAKKWSLLVGVNTLPLSYSTPLTFDGTHTTAKLDGNFTNVHAFAEFQPFKTSAFRIVGGLGYFLSGKVDGKLTLNDDQKYGDLTISSSDIGTATMTLDWKGIAPYLGVGLFKGIPKNKFSVNLDLGTYYLVQPHATMSGTNLLSENYKNSDQLSKNTQGYQWLPVLQINFNYKLSK